MVQAFEVAQLLNKQSILEAKQSKQKPGRLLQQHNCI